MNALLRTALLILAVLLQLPGISFAKQIYMKDGSILECESFWRRNGWVVVKVNRDILLEFTPAEVDLNKTFHKTAATKPRRKTKENPTPVSATPTKEAAEVPVQATPAVVKSQEVKLEQPAGPTKGQASVTAKAAPAAVPSQPAPPLAKPSVPAANMKAEPESAAASAPGVEPAMTKEEYEKRTRENAELMAQAIRENNADLMKKAIAAQRELAKQKNSSKRSVNLPMKAEPAWFKYFLMLMASCLFIIVAMWAIFRKAGESGWKCLVPIYNMYVLMQISGKPGWWGFLMLIPFVGVPIYLLAMISLAEKFGRSAAYGAGLFLLPMFFFPMLAFGGAKYEEAPPKELEFTFSEEPLN